MTPRHSPLQQLFGIGLAAVATVAMLGSVDRLSSRPVVEMQMAKKAAATRVVATDAPALPPVAAPRGALQPTGAGAAAT